MNRQRAAAFAAYRQRPTSWQTFLKAHWGVIAAADFFTTEVWRWRGLVTYYTVFVIDLASHRVHHRERNHQGLDNRLVAGTPATDRTRRVRCRRRLGGLLNFYERAA